MSSILELPEDILLELAKDLDVADLISLLSTCRVIRKIELQKTLWLDALVRIQEVERQPHPLSNTQNLGTFSPQQLQHTAQQVNRLVKNWSSDNPRPTRIGQLSVEPNHGFFCLPGTPLIVTHADAGGTMSCWDILEGKHVAHLELPGLFVRTKIPCMEEEGRALICAVIGIGLSVESVYFFFRGSSVDADGSVQSLPLFPRPSDPDPPQMVTTVIPNRYSVASFKRRMHHMPSSLSSQEPYACLPRYGVFAVTRRLFQWKSSPIFVIHFWQGEIASSERGAFLKPGEPYHYEQRDNIRLWAVGVSGTYVLLLVAATSSSDGGEYLGLLHFTMSPTPHTTFRKLDIGDAATRLESVSRMALDDALGTISLLDAEGWYTLSQYCMYLNQGRQTRNREIMDVLDGTRIFK
ncbi:hypothetical protein C8F04DRAFT_1193341 [Mycena alexandri]|uniref:F-box domain-containing protein n=1 Tax=Mycena alexandri TaxID=1745969 RepID=A0AAD6WQQ4_9AGAR|nr:hypothetical protein C8F04DRAFT_1193341 [Mycena alexandri]